MAILIKNGRAIQEGTVEELRPIVTHDGGTFSYIKYNDAEKAEYARTHPRPAASTKRTYKEEPKNAPRR